MRTWLHTVLSVSMWLFVCWSIYYLLFHFSSYSRIEKDLLWLLNHLILCGKSNLCTISVSFLLWSRALGKHRFYNSLFPVQSNIQCAEHRLLRDVWDCRCTWLRCSWQSCVLDVQPRQSVDQMGKDKSECEETLTHLEKREDVGGSMVTSSSCGYPCLCE